MELSPFGDHVAIKRREINNNNNQEKESERGRKIHVHVHILHMSNLFVSLNSFQLFLQNILRISKINKNHHEMQTHIHIHTFMYMYMQYIIIHFV